MAQESVTHTNGQVAQRKNHGHAATSGMLGPLLCWAVVFADIGTSVYYTPGILYQTVQGLAGFFVFLTLFVFILLSIKYVEVTHRFPQGGGVVTVAAQALNPWFGALGGMFILVDYFLTAATSCLSGILYFSIVTPVIGPYALWITVVFLILLGILNWVGISESAKVSFVGAVIAFVSDMAILGTVFSHLSFAQFLGIIGQMFSGHRLTPLTFLTGFSGAFLAFSGLESISQLSPVMKQPHKKVAGIAMLLVVITVGLSSPLLTMFATILQPQAAGNEVQSAQLVSLLAGKWGGPILQTEVAISASALLVFASNTAIIGAYHVFMALSRMEFLPTVILQRNRLRGTPHYSIALATIIPIIVLVAVRGNINILGDMYAFGLLGAFSLTCLGLDIVRYREWKNVRRRIQQAQTQTEQRGTEGLELAQGTERPGGQIGIAANGSRQAETRIGLWFKVNFFLGVLTTALVTIAWTTNLIAKPLATTFGGSVTILGMIVAYANYTYYERQGRTPVPFVLKRIEGQIPGSILAVLTSEGEYNEAIIHAAINTAGKSKPLIFLYLSTYQRGIRAPRMMEIVDAYLEDPQAKQVFGRAENLLRKAGITQRKYVYIKDTPNAIAQIWQRVHPYDTILALENEDEIKDINPDRIRYELTPEGRVAHMLKRWS